MHAPPSGRHHPARHVRDTFSVVLAVCAILFLALGVWQIERREEKLALIAAVDARVAAPPSAAPGPSDWPAVTAQTSSYQHVRVEGLFDHDRETLVQAVTDMGQGYWVVTPLQTAAGWTVLVNRGFVSADDRERAKRRSEEPLGRRTVVGLLRISEPRGAFLRSNDPEAGRWYSRDVAEIGKARRLTHLAPYFIDAVATEAPKGQPIGGLTVVRFYNHHLEYALTWFALAALSIVGIVVVRRADR